MVSLISISYFLAEQTYVLTSSDVSRSIALILVQNSYYLFRRPKLKIKGQFSQYIQIYAITVNLTVYDQLCRSYLTTREIP